MGALELIVVSAVSVFGVALWIVRSDPELSPVALMFLGLLITYGSMPFYYSYDSGSVPSRFIRQRLPGLRFQPLIVVGGSIALRVPGYLDRLRRTLGVLAREPGAHPAVAAFDPAQVVPAGLGEERGILGAVLLTAE